MTRPIIQFGAVPVGEQPKVVGIISHADSVSHMLHAPPCHIVEMRLDHMDVDQPNWQQAAMHIEEQGLPVLATLRWSAEGGQWTGADEARLLYLLKAMDLCSAIDVELESACCAELAAEALARNKALVLSYHDFERTPSMAELESIMERAAINAHVLVKIAAYIREPDDIGRLSDFLAKPHPAPLCLIGMGELGQRTRVEFPRQGSCLAYGYLDTPTAPGQMSCEAMMKHLYPKA